MRIGLFKVVRSFALTLATNENLHVNEVAIVDGLTMSTTRVSRER
jgi:hypothetical protein